MKQERLGLYLEYEVADAGSEGKNFGGTGTTPPRKNNALKMAKFKEMKREAEAAKKGGSQG